MPTRAGRPCPSPGCPRVVRGGKRYCDEHQAEEYRRQDERRGTATQRGYGAGWRDKRDYFIAQNPVCERCGRSAATVAHHVVRKRDGGSDDPINLKALCQLCHAQVHAAAKELFGGGGS